MIIDADSYEELQSIPEPERTSTALEQVDLMRRFVAWMIYRYKLPQQIEFSRLELDHAPIETLLIERSKVGNAKLTIDLKGLGS